MPSLRKGRLRELRNRQAALSRQKRRFRTARQERHRVLPKAIGLGLLTGCVAVAFHLALDMAEAFRDEPFRLAHAEGISGWAAIGAFSVCGVIGAAWLVRRFAPEAGGSGIPHLKNVLHGDAQLRCRSLVVVKILSGVAGIGAGLALGREGPTVQKGAAVGHALSVKETERAGERNTLIAAGGGAGLSAAFNAPLSGLIFVLEELKGTAASSEFFVAALACLSADMVCRILLGQFPVFQLPPMDTPALHLMPFFLLLGGVCGLFGVVFNRSLLFVSNAFSWPGRPWWQAGWCVLWALTLLFIGWKAPEALGSGQRFVNVILDGHALGAQLIPGYFLVRFLLTVGSYSTGVAGGIFSPILVLGALLGLGLANAAGSLLPESDFEPRVFAIVGMAAYFTAVVRAPLTGMVLIIEMTGNYGLVLPLFAACLAALTTADALHDLPIYEALLERDMSRRRAEDQAPVG